MSGMVQPYEDVKMEIVLQGLAIIYVVGMVALFSTMLYYVCGGP